MGRVGRFFRLGLLVCVLAALPLATTGVFAASGSGANGDIVFVRGGAIFFTSTGASSGVAGTDPAWSPDGTKLAYVDGSGKIETCTVTGGACASPSGPLQTGTQPAWSPDGKLIAYTTPAGIHVMSATGTGDGALANSAAGDADPSWSPDGTQIVFDRSGGALVVLTYPGGASSGFAVSSPPGAMTDPAWSPDGRTIAFVSGSHVYVVPAAGGSPTAVVTSGTDSSPNWSPDGSALVYADATAGIEVVAQGVGGAWGSPTAHTSSPGDATPDWQAVAPIRGTAPTITGGFSPQTGSLLTATNGTWQGASSSGFGYQWERCDSGGANCSSIGGATAQSYAPGADDLGDTLRVVVTASNPAGSTASEPSPQTGVVVAAGTVVPPSNLALPTLRVSNGSELGVGSFLFASPGTWTGSFPITYAYQWVQCPADDPLNGPCYPIAGARSSFFAVPESLYGLRVRIVVTATNAAGSVHASSPASDVVTATAPHLGDTPPIVGSNVVDQTLSVGPGTWKGLPRPTVSYQWRRCDADGTLPSCVDIPGATSSTYRVVTADVGFTLRVYLTGTNVAGKESDYTNHTYPIVDRQHFAPAALTPPTISGTPQVGVELSATAASFQGDQPISSTLQWQRCDATGSACRGIAGATKLAYTPTGDDVGSTLRLVATGTNTYGKGLDISQVTEPVAGVYPHVDGKHIAGHGSDDYLIGTPYDDVITGGAGNDTILGNGGYDRVDGGAGNDVITVTAPGGSTVDAGAGSDTVYAQNGVVDTVDCGSGRDRAVVDAGDTVSRCEVVERGGSSAGPSSGGSLGDGGLGDGGSGGESAGGD